MTKDNSIKVSDLSIGNLFQNTDSSQMLHYWAPEVLRFNDFSIKSDVWYTFCCCFCFYVFY